MAYRSFGVILADIIQATKGTANSSGASPKYSLHLPLNRQSATYAREGIDLDVSTLADWVGAAAATLMPLVTAILMHVFAGEGIHADDTTVPVLAKGKTRTGRLWTYVRDDRPFAGPIQQRRCSSTRAIVAASIPSNICRRTPMLDDHRRHRRHMEQGLLARCKISFDLVRRRYAAHWRVALRCCADRGRCNEG
jgi:Transposase IS66 family